MEKKDKEAQKYFEQARRRSALKWTEIYQALKHRGMEGFKKTIIKHIKSD